MKYWAPYNGVSGDINSNDGYADGNAATGTQGSIPTFRPFEQMQRELVNLVTKSGLTPDATLNGIQVAQSVALGKVNFAASTGAVNVLVVTLDPVPVAYVTGMRVWFTPNNTNTATATINVNGLGAKTIKRSDGSALQPGDLFVGMGAGLIYNGTDFTLITTTPQQIKQLSAVRTRTIFSTPGAYSFTIPAGVYTVVAKAWGAGGAGGYGASGNPGGAASGGAGGGYCTKVLAVTPGAAITGSVGTGSAGSSSAGSDGPSGTNSTFIFAATTYTGGGGTGGKTAAATIQQSAQLGGTQTNGDETSQSAMMSINGIFSNNGTSIYAIGGSGSPGGGAAGGAMGSAGVGPGNAGLAPGGGGGGGGGTVGSAAAGGNGAHGQVWFEY